MSMFSTPSSRAVPALPGATYTLETRGELASFHASACSRPAPPITSSFMRDWPQGERREKKRNCPRASCPSLSPFHPLSLFDSMRLVPEVPMAGKHHRDTALVCGG